MVAPSLSLDGPLGTLRTFSPLALISVLCWSCCSCPSATAQEVSVVPVCVAVLRSGVNTVSVTEARDRLVEALNQHKTDTKSQLSVQAVALSAPSGVWAMAEAREKNCRFVVSTHLTSLATNFRHSDLEGTPEFHVFDAVIEYQINRVVDGSGFAIGSIQAEDTASSRAAIWRALGQLARRASAEITDGKGMPNVPGVAEMPSVAALGSTFQSVNEVNARDYCRWLSADIAHAEVLRGACEFAIPLREKMPNFTCEQSTMRYRGENPTPIDSISASVWYEDGNESYRDVKVNGRLVSAGSDESPGLQSTGEFAGDLRAVFDQSNQARFRYVSEGQVGDHVAWIFAYQIVQQKDQNWLLLAPGQTIAPPYSGELWIDQENGTLLRFRSVATDFPPTFPMKNVSLQIDYAKTTFSDGADFVLPVDSTLTNIYAGAETSRNVMQFRNCHKFRAKAHMVLNER